ncbi:MAG: putative ABC transport system permease protein, partial [Candidatus Azotimanducaceae bacterium]
EKSLKEKSLNRQGGIVLIIKLAIRNLFRNTRRTILTVMLIGFSLSALIITDGVVKGMSVLMIENVTQSLAGEAQIHHHQYRENHEVKYYMPNSHKIEEALSKDESISSFASRVISGGMISSSYNVTSGGFYGVDALKEMQVSKLKLAISSGTYLSGKDKELIMGESMARLLEVDIGDRIVLTLSEVDTGELTQALFRVTGLFNFGIREIDKNLIFINIDKARKMLRLKRTDSHEIVVQFMHPQYAMNRNLPFFSKFTNDETEALGWLDLNPEIASVIEMSSYASLILGSILFLLATLGIINSLFMSIYERIYEFGVIRAIGTRSTKLTQLIICEAFFLAIIACIFGIVVSLLITQWTSVHGIPVGEIEFSGIAINNSIKTQSTLSQFIEFPLYVIVLTLVASLYPARFASKIIPAEALQRSL